jgi:hypothetical protein
MSVAYRTGFSQLDVHMPCCGSESSLNHLEYDWPAGFSRFVLVARNPNTDIDRQQLESVGKLLNCEIRKIWTHY